MKTKLIAAVAVISAAVLSFTAPSVFAGKGHGSGGFSGVSGAGHGRGSSGYSSGFSGYSKGFSNHGYSGGLKGYTGGGLGRVYSGYGQKAYSSPKSYSNRIHSSYPANRTVGAGKNYYSSQKSYGQQFKRGQSATNQTNRIAKNSQFQGAYGNRAVQHGAKAGFVGKQNQNLTTRDGKNHPGNWARNNLKNQNRFNGQTQDKLRNWQGHKSSFAEAKQRHHGDHDGDHHDHNGHHHHHDHDWWHNHCGAIIVVGGGWWGWWDGWWYPAWGYDPYYSYYAYDGPIYGYGGLAPDEVTANVQSELQNLGYYSGTVDGVLGPQTQEALHRYQRDRGLPVTGAIDAETVSSLGLS